MGAVSGLLGVIAVIFSAWANRRSGTESLAHVEMVDALRDQRERIDDQRERIDDLDKRLRASESAEHECRRELSEMSERLRTLTKKVNGR